MVSVFIINVIVVSLAVVFNIIMAINVIIRLLSMLIHNAIVMVSVLRLRTGQFFLVINHMPIPHIPITLAVIMVILTAAMPLAEPRKLPVREDVSLETEPVVKIAGAAVIVAVIAFFIVFW